MKISKVPDSIVENIDTYCETRAATHAPLEQASPIYKQLVELNNKALSAPLRTGGLSQKEKLLVLLGIHATQGTEQSIDFAVTAAMQAGVPEAEMLDALDLALLTGGGSAVSRVQLAAAVMAHRQATSGQKPRLDFLGP